MTLIAAIILSFVCLTSADLEKYGPFRAILYSNAIKCDHSREQNLDVGEAKVYFYDFANNYNLTFPITTAAENITAAYNLDVTRRLIVFVPGYKSHISKSKEETVRQTFQDFPNSYLIIIDHSEYTSSRGGKLDSYARSVNYVYYIGRALGSFLSGIHKSGYPSSQIHCIGHSLGAHILGHTGEFYTNHTGEKIWRITGLDPAGPCFSNSFIEEQLRSGVANYVEVYHCNSGGLGSASVLADTDFVFNKGRIQPQCHKALVPGFGSENSKCSHKACVEYYLLTVKNKDWYLATKCDTYKKYSKGECAGNQVTIAGFWNPGNATGQYFVTTDSYGV